MPPPPSRRSPPKYRHDGTSPLPLGMDWSPPPKKWDGRDTIWPHDPRSGWSYCVIILSWFSQPDLGSADQILINPVVFYRVQICIQSPEGVSTAYGINRRFSDFLKLFSELKKAFPKKKIPQAPPKHSFLRINSSHVLLEERRYSLEEWIGRLLSDIDLSRSVQVASFLELEAAARSSFIDSNEPGLQSNDIVANFSSKQITTCTGSTDGSLSIPSASQSIESDRGSNNVYETSELHFSTRKPSGHNLITNGNGLTIESASDQIDSAHRINNIFHGNNASGITAKTELLPEAEHDKHPSHSRMVSSESVGSDISSIRGSEISIPSTYNSLGDAYVSLSGVTGNNIILPLNQQNKLNRLLITLQRRLTTGKTDMEDLIARLNQEMAVKEYLKTKVNDLEVELENTKQRSIENLQQAIMSEREHVTQMQWDMYELQRKYSEIVSKLEIEQNERTTMETEKIAVSVDERETFIQDLDEKNEQIKNLQKTNEDMELKSKSDIEVLVEEIKSLRNFQSELEETIDKSEKEKFKSQSNLQKEKQKHSQELISMKNLIYECGVLRHRLQECSVDVLSEEEGAIMLNSSSLTETLDTLTTSDSRIGLLLAEAQLLAQEYESSVFDMDSTTQEGVIPRNVTTDSNFALDNEARKMLTDILIDNAKLRKHVNSIIRSALKADNKSEKDDDTTTTRNTVLNKYLER